MLMHNKIHRYSLMKQVHDDKLAMLRHTSMTTTPGIAYKASVLQFTLLFTCVHMYAWFLAYLIVDHLRNSGCLVKLLEMQRMKPLFVTVLVYW